MPANELLIDADWQAYIHKMKGHPNFTGWLSAYVKDKQLKNPFKFITCTISFLGLLSESLSRRQTVVHFQNQCNDHWDWNTLVVGLHAMYVLISSFSQRAIPNRSIFASVYAICFVNTRTEWALSVYSLHTESREKTTFFFSFDYALASPSSQIEWPTLYRVTCICTGI